MSNKISFMYQLDLEVNEEVVTKYLNPSTSLDELGETLSPVIELILKANSNKTNAVIIKVDYLAYDNNKGVEN